jgi:hypothetical protein
VVYAREYQRPADDMKIHGDCTHHIHTRTRKFSPDAFRLAQSRGLCPGESATFPFLLGIGRVVLGTDKDDDLGTDRETAGWRLVRAGRGGGGMSSKSVRTFGSSEDEGDIRWALDRLGNAGGLSSSWSSDCSSSSDGGGDISNKVGTERVVAGLLLIVEVEVHSQLGRYEVIVVFESRIRRMIAR